MTFYVISKKRKKSCFFEIRKKRKIPILEHWLWLCASYLWSIPVTWRTSHGHAGSLWLVDKQVTFELPDLLNASSFDWIKLNVNETAYYRVNYMQRNWRALVNAIRRQHTVGLPIPLICFISLS